MCGCEFNFVCSRCAGTPRDPGYFDQPDPREQQQTARERLISEPDFLSPWGQAATR